jgi:thiol:disulfide interchange protein DsbD
MKKKQFHWLKYTNHKEPSLKRLVVLLLFSISVLYGKMSFLKPEEAFIPSATFNHAESRIDVVIIPGQDIYIYQDSVKAEVKKADGLTAGESRVVTAAVEHHGEQVFLETVKIEIPLSKSPDVSGKRQVDVEIAFQGCSEQGLCYEPMKQLFSLQVDTSAVSGATSGTATSAPTPSQNAAADTAESSGSETDQIADVIKKGSLLVILLTFFGFGLLLSLTPCVFPMIPILSSVIISQGNGMTTKRAFWLSLVYVLAMSAAYTIAGVLAGLFGSNLQAAFQTPWVIITFSLLFVLLSFSMFGMYELQLPNFLQSRLTKAGSSHSGPIGVAIMGFLSALIVGPCVAAPLAGALIYIGQTGDALIGGLALFALSIGMGIPLLIVGTTAGKFMPKPGAWMELVRSFFGVLLLGVAIWMIGRIVPEPVILILWSSLLMFVAVHLGALEPLGPECQHCARASKKAFAVFIFVYSIVLFIGGFTGGTSLINPLEKLQSPQSMITNVTNNAQQAETFKVVKSSAELDALLEASKGKRVLLDFYADWCVACKELEEVTFSDPAVRVKMSEFVMIQADITDNSDDQKAMTKRYGLFGPPAIIFFDETGKVMPSKSIVGFKKPDVFLEHLNSL